MDTRCNTEYDNHIDSDSLAQLDEEIKRVMGAMGHFGNEFAAAADSGDHSGRQFGVYGSFLPLRWERFDLQPSINLPLAASPKAPSDTLSAVKLGTAAPLMENKKP